MNDNDILVIFRKITKEFAEIDDAEILDSIGLCRDFVSEKRFGKFYGRAVAYYTAHELSMRDVIEFEGAGSSSITAGNVLMEKEGDLQRQYGSSETTDSDDSLLGKTYYGKKFLQLRAMCIVPVMTRMG